MVLVKPATVVQWHRKGFRLYWRWRSRHLGRPQMSIEIRDLVRRISWLYRGPVIFLSARHC
jgi:putative transposase